MKILLVTEYFPPENAIASLRLYSFAKYFHRAGHDITVLTTLKNKNKNDLEADCSCFNVIRVAIPFLSKPSSLDADTVLDSQKKKHNNKSVLKKILFPIKKFYFFFSDKTGCFSLRFPHFCDLWVKKAIKLINPFNYDIVLSSGGPYSVHRAGLAIKKKNPKIRWIVDWRDLWTKNPISKGFLIFHPYEILLEKKFHKNADLITTVSDPINKTLTSMTPTTVKTIYNGFDTDDFSVIQKENRIRNDEYKIVFTGSLYRKLQDPSPLFAAVSQIKNKNIALYNKIRIQFAGPNSDVSDIAEKYNVLDIFSYLGFINRKESLKLQYNASAVLFIDFKNTDGVLPGKLFEYINVSRKIIAIGDNSASSAVELIKNTNTGIYLGENIDLIEQHLISCLNNPDDDIYKKNDLLIQEFTRRNQADKLLNYILQLFD